MGKARKGLKGKKGTGNIPIEQRGAPRMRPPGHIPLALRDRIFGLPEAAFFAVFSRLPEASLECPRKEPPGGLFLGSREAFRGAFDSCDLNDLKVFI